MKVVPSLNEQNFLDAIKKFLFLQLTVHSYYLSKNYEPVNSYFIIQKSLIYATFAGYITMFEVYKIGRIDKLERVENWNNSR